MTKDKTVNFRVNEIELNELENKIKKSGYKRSIFLRKIIASSIVIENDKEYQKRVQYLLSNLSNNINQIAYHANVIKKIDVKVLNELKDIHTFIKSIDIKSSK